MTEDSKLNCPVCGTAMNHHCDKLVYLADAETQSAEILDGVVLEFHTCPSCGSSQSRPEQ